LIKKQEKPEAKILDKRKKNGYTHPYKAVKVYKRLRQI